MCEENTISMQSLKNIGWSSNLWVNHLVFFINVHNTLDKIREAVFLCMIKTRLLCLLCENPFNLNLDLGQYSRQGFPIATFYTLCDKS